MTSIKKSERFKLWFTENGNRLAYIPYETEKECVAFTKRKKYKQYGFLIEDEKRNTIMIIQE